MKDYRDNDDESHDNCDDDKYDVNDNNNDIVVHTFIVCDDTWSLQVVILLTFCASLCSLFVFSFFTYAVCWKSKTSIYT